MSRQDEGRQGRVERKTKETEVGLQLNLDGTGAVKVRTPIPFFSHMLEAWAKHGLIDLSVAIQLIDVNFLDGYRIELIERYNG